MGRVVAKPHFPDQFSVEQLEIYFVALVDSHSWATVRVDRNGLQFFWKYVLKKDWQWLEIIKPPKIQSLPDILSVGEVLLACTDCDQQLHVVVPGGDVNKTTRQWKKTRGKLLFNKTALAKVFRARLMTAIRAAGLALPGKLPNKWVVHCKHVGKGAPALKCLSRYLYRGVISENNIVANNNGKVIFRYIDGNTGQTRYHTLKGEDFLWLVLQHVLPKGFRRVRDYGFLHGNARKLLVLIQLTLKVMVTIRPARPRPVFKCPSCQSPMRIMGFIRPAWPSG